MYLCFIDYQEEEEKDQISIPGNSDKTYKEKVIIYTNCLTGKPESPTVHSCKWLS